MGVGYPTTCQAPTLGRIKPALGQQGLAVVAVPFVPEHDLVSDSHRHVLKQGTGPDRDIVSGGIAAALVGEPDPGAARCQCVVLEYQFFGRSILVEIVQFNRVKRNGLYRE